MARLSISAIKASSYSMPDMTFMYESDKLTIPEIPDSLFASVNICIKKDYNHSFEVHAYKYFGYNIKKSEFELLLQIVFDEYPRVESLLKTMPFTHHENMHIAYNLVPEFNGKTFVVFENKLVVASGGKIEKKVDLVTLNSEITLDGINIAILKANLDCATVLITRAFEYPCVQKFDKDQILIANTEVKEGIYDITKDSVMQTVVDFMREKFMARNPGKPIEKAKLHMAMVTSTVDYPIKRTYTIFDNLMLFNKLVVVAFGTSNICCVTKKSYYTAQSDIYDMLYRLQGFDLDHTYCYFFDGNRMVKEHIRKLAENWYDEKFIYCYEQGALFVDEKNELFSCKFRKKHGNGKVVVADDAVYMFSKSCIYILSKDGVSKSHVLDIQDFDFFLQTTKKEAML